MRLLNAYTVNCKLQKVPKVKEGGKKKAKKVKEEKVTPPPPKPSSFAALESHAKDILSKMDQQPKKAKVNLYIMHILYYTAFHNIDIIYH